MLVRVLLAAILAGVAGGVFATAVQALRVTPLILQAETYEHAGATQTHDAAVVRPHDHDAASPGEAGWTPADGLERTFFTLIANIVVGAGFALIVTAAILVSGQKVTLASGLVWGLAGFVTFVLAPAIGLPPQLPGTVTADLTSRQLWWLATVVATGGALAILAFRRRAAWLAAAVVLMAMPHLYGAPQPVTHEALAPAHLAVEFAVASIASGFVYWLFLGGLLGFMLDRAMRAEAAAGGREAAV